MWRLQSVSIEHSKNKIVCILKTRLDRELCVSDILARGMVAERKSGVIHVNNFIFGMLYSCVSGILAGDMLAEHKSGVIQVNNFTFGMFCSYGQGKFRVSIFLDGGTGFYFS